MIAIRRALPDDLAHAARIAADAYLHDGLLDADDHYLDELRDTAARAAEAELLVALADGAVVGTVTIAAHGSVWAEIAEPGEHELRMLAVAPEARGRGVAEALVVEALRRARAAGSHRAVLSSLSTMRSAHRLYERMQLRRDPERDWNGEENLLHVYTVDLVAWLDRR